MTHLRKKLEVTNLGSITNTALIKVDTFTSKMISHKKHLDENAIMPKPYPG